MVHFYGEISEQEIYNIIQEELEDSYTFCGFVNKILKDPSKFNLVSE